MVEPRTGGSGLLPPLQLAWRSGHVFNTAVTGNGRVYGINANNKIVALSAADGSQLWESANTYLPGRLAIQGNRLFAYVLGQGFGFIDDGTTPTERLALSFGVSPTVNASVPVADGRMVYLAVNAGLTAWHQDEGLRYGSVLRGADQPYSVGLLAPGEIVVLNGRGVPTLYRAGTDSFSVGWTGESHGVDTGLTYRPFALAGNRLIIGVGPDTVAYDTETGRVAWHLSNVPARALSIAGDTVYAAFNGAAITAIRSSDGWVLWRRQYMYMSGLQQTLGLVSGGDYLFCGGAVAENPDAGVLMAVRRGDGALAWVSRSASGDWAAGLPVYDGVRVIACGTSHTGAYADLASRPAVLPSHLEVDPAVLCGPASGFGTGMLRLHLPVAARINLSAYRERQGLGTRIVTNAVWGVGPHSVTWSPGTAGGYTGAPQFGYLLLDVEENSGLRYTQTVLLPVNTFPDIVSHWAGASIERMVYLKYLNGYEDRTFRPDWLVTRAECSTIIAKTLNLEAPGAGFRTKFTDIGTHWARNYIMALEERGIMGGFLEPDGTYTFRPDMSMTRAQEARVLVGAYAVPAAPDGFVSRFTDIAGHWAAPDIRALEAAGFVTGFAEPNGTYTYRPEQLLTRAELCTLVVRIRGL